MCCLAVSGKVELKEEGVDSQCGSLSSLSEQNTFLCNGYRLIPARSLTFLLGKAKINDNILGMYRSAYFRTDRQEVIRYHQAVVQQYPTGVKYEGNSISKLQNVIEKNRMEIMTHKQHLFFNIISTQI